MTTIKLRQFQDEIMPELGSPLGATPRATGVLHSSNSVRYTCWTLDATTTLECARLIACRVDRLHLAKRRCEPDCKRCKRPCAGRGAQCLRGRKRHLLVLGRADLVRAFSFFALQSEHEQSLRPPLPRPTTPAVIAPRHHRQHR